MAAGDDPVDFERLNRILDHNVGDIALTFDDASREYGVAMEELVLLVAETDSDFGRSYMRNMETEEPGRYIFDALSPFVWTHLFEEYLPHALELMKNPPPDSLALVFVISEPKGDRMIFGFVERTKRPHRVVFGSPGGSA